MAKEGITADLEESKGSSQGSDRGDGGDGHLHQDLQDAAAAFDESDRGFWPVLKNRQFLALWAGQIFSQLADKVFLVMAIAIITTRFQQADQPISGWVSSVMIAFTIPAVLFGSLAGVYVDRWSKKTVLVLTNLVRGLLVLGIPPLLLVTADLPGWTIGDYYTPVGFGALLGITFAVSTLTQYFAPAEQSTLPMLVKKENLLSANSLYTTTMMGAVIIGFALGEPLLAIANGWVEPWSGSADLGQELAVGGSYLLAGLLLILVRTGEKRDEDSQNQPHILEDLKEGLDYLRQTPVVRNAIIQLTILFSIVAALAVIAVRIAELIPVLKASQFGVLMAMGGVGMGIGAAILGQFGDRIPYTRLSFVGSTVVAGGLAALAFNLNTLWGTLICLGVVGIGCALSGIPMQTTIQNTTPEAMHGKVFGLQNNAINIALSLPLALASLAESWVGLPTVLFTLAGVAIAGALATWSISSMGSRR
ncbi:MAG: MFS transporter [Cyanophyceae cyanobacterium]